MAARSTAAFTSSSEIVRAVRQAVGRKFLFGVRLSAQGFQLPADQHHACRSCSRCATISCGNDLPETLPTTPAGWSSSASTICISTAASVSPIPRAARATIPTTGFTSFVNATRHLSGKARRARRRVQHRAAGRQEEGVRPGLSLPAGGQCRLRRRHPAGRLHPRHRQWRFPGSARHQPCPEQPKNATWSRSPGRCLPTPIWSSSSSHRGQACQPVFFLYLVLFADGRLPAGLLRSASFSIPWSR